MLLILLLLLTNITDWVCTDHTLREGCGLGQKGPVEDKVTVLMLRMTVLMLNVLRFGWGAGWAKKFLLMIK